MANASGKIKRTLESVVRSRKLAGIPNRKRAPARRRIKELYLEDDDRGGRCN